MAATPDNALRHCVLWSGIRSGIRSVYRPMLGRSQRRVSVTREHRQMWVFCEARIGKREPTQIEPRSAHRRDGFSVPAVGAQADLLSGWFHLVYDTALRALAAGTVDA